ncbi:MAG TPA: hypothetical protein VLT62_22355 [Candidatus Methylomirabilis sp.]|nr:hypothetical protein [Candidatus Methylomirabilis sp.]
MTSTAGIDWRGMLAQFLTVFTVLLGVGVLLAVAWAVWRGRR